MKEFRVMYCINGKVIEGNCIASGSKAKCEEIARRNNAKPETEKHRSVSFKVLPCIV